MELKEFVKNISPDFALNFYRRFRGVQDAQPVASIMREHKIEGGILKGHSFLIDENQSWQKLYTDGNYDKEVQEYVQRISLNGKTVMDVGGHFGYLSMIFAKTVGANGRILIVEPMPANIEKINANFSLNEDLNKIVEVIPLAISDKKGTVQFNTSSGIEDGRSSMGHITTSDTFFNKSEYDHWGFIPIEVQTERLDDLMIQHNISNLGLIKFDIEGAENMALEGGRELISNNKCHVIIEVHSIFNMLFIGNYFAALNYKIELIKKEADGRCLIAASPK